MRYLQLGRLSFLKELEPYNVELGLDIETIQKEVTPSEAPEGKVLREAAEARVLARMRRVNFGPIGQSRRKIFLAKMMSSSNVSALGRLEFLI